MAQRTGRPRTKPNLKRNKVPVGRGRQTSFTPELRKKFLDHLAETHSVIGACDICGFTYATVYYWRDNDEEFEKAWEEAIQRYRDKIETEVRRRGLEGWDEPLTYQGMRTGETIRKHSDRMLELLATRRIPEFHPSLKIEGDIQHSGTIRLEHSVDFAKLTPRGRELVRELLGEVAKTPTAKRIEELKAKAANGNGSSSQKSDQG